MESLEREDKLVKYSSYYTEEKFKDKLLRVARKAGVKVIYAVFILYYALQDKSFPAKEKAIILGALGYFILPIDILPDVVPFIGYTDDLIALLFAIRQVYAHITPEIKTKAKEKAQSLFGHIGDKDLDLF